MKKILLIFSMIVWFFSACDKPAVEKPDKLIKRKLMIEMLVDVHLAEATFTHMRYDSIVQKSSSANFYYSILEKYGVSDSLFEKSYVYYLSEPKEFEKMYREVMNELSIIEQQYSGRKEELEFENTE